MSVIDNDKGWKRIKESLKTSTSFVKVGVLSSAGAHEGTSMTMARLAAVHEFGSPANNIPARPFLKQTIDRIKDDIIKFNKDNLAEIIKGKMTTGNALRRLGVYVVREVKKEFRIGDFEPLKQSTIRAKTVNGKKGEIPLIDTGRLRNSINFEVIE